MRPLLVLLAALALLPAADASAASTCHATTLAGDADPTLDSTSLGSDAPAAYEIGLADTGRTDRVMLLIHGGGWTKVGQGALNAEHRAARAWRAAGWTTVNLDYRACRKSDQDVIALYDLVRAKFGDVPICAQGESAGGHLALNLAVRRPELACVIAYAAPTDLRHSTRTVKTMATAAFGAKRLTRLSPAARADAIHARLLLATADDDTLVPLSQAHALKDAVDDSVYTDVVAMPAGRLTFVHGTTTPAALLTLERHVATLVQPYGRAPTTLPPPPFLPFPRHL